MKEEKTKLGQGLLKGLNEAVGHESGDVKLRESTIEQQASETVNRNVTLHSNRLVAFIDILGFSQRIQTVPIEQVHRVLSTFIDRAKRDVFFQQQDVPGVSGEKMFNFEVMQFAFDTLILVSGNPSHTYADANFIFACNQLMRSAAEVGLPLRGVIGCGDVLSDLSRDMLLSSSFAHLAKMEKEQEWMGCAVTEEAGGRIAAPLLGSTIDFNPHSPVVRYDIPMKSGGRDSLPYCLNWVSTISPSACARIVQSLPSPKRENTLSFVKAIVETVTHRQKIDPPAGNVHFFGYVATRLKADFGFYDANGEPCDPTEPVTINMTDKDGNSGSVTFGVKA